MKLYPVFISYIWSIFVTILFDLYLINQFHIIPNIPSFFVVNHRHLMLCLYLYLLLITKVDLKYYGISFINLVPLQCNPWQRYDWFAAVKPLQVVVLPSNKFKFLFLFTLLASSKYTTSSSLLTCSTTRDLSPSMTRTWNQQHGVQQ